MKKQLKYLATAGLLLALLLAAGCGDDAKDKKEVDKPDIKTEQKTDQKAKPVVVRPQDGKYYKYPSHFNDATKTPKITPEMVKYIDDFASTVEIHPSYKGKFINNSRIKNPDEKIHYISMHAIGPNHNEKIKFKNSKGKEVYQHQVYTINMQIEAATNKLTSVLCSIFEQNPDIPDGKTTYVVRKSFD